MSLASIASRRGRRRAYRRRRGRRRRRGGAPRRGGRVSRSSSCRRVAPAPQIRCSVKGLVKSANASAGEASTASSPSVITRPTIPITPRPRPGRRTRRRRHSGECVPGRLQRGEGLPRRYPASTPPGRHRLPPPATPRTIPGAVVAIARRRIQPPQLALHRPPSARVSARLQCAATPTPRPPPPRTSSPPPATVLNRRPASRPSPASRPRLILPPCHPATRRPRPSASDPSGPMLVNAGETRRGPQLAAAADRRRTGRG